jgi:hypothetical protein
MWYHNTGAVLWRKRHKIAVRNFIAHAPAYCAHLDGQAG